MCTEVLFPGLNRSRREAHHSPPSSAEAKSSIAIPPLIHTSSWRGVYLMKHGDSFTCTLLAERYAIGNVTVAYRVLELLESSQPLSQWVKLLCSEW
jgi:hypothetical protein